MKQIIADIKYEIHEIQVTRGPVRKFGFILSTILLLIGAWLYYRESPYALALLSAGLLGAGTAAIWPMLYVPIYYGLTAVSIVIGYFLSRLILVTMFMAFFAPVGLITRVFRRDLLKKRIDKNAATYWLKKEYPQDRKQSAELMY